MINMCTLELAMSSDFDDYLCLKSEPSNIYWSGFSSAPEREKLKQHFLAALNNKTRDVYLLKESEKVIGYLYIDYLLEGNTAELAYGISEFQAGRGLAKLMIGFALEKIPSDIDIQIAWIAESNIPSIKTIEALGFNNTADVEYRDLAQFTSKVKFTKFTRNNKN